LGTLVELESMLDVYYRACGRYPITLPDLAKVPAKASAACVSVTDPNASQSLTAHRDWPLWKLISGSAANSRLHDYSFVYFTGANGSSFALTATPECRGLRSFELRSGAGGISWAASWGRRGFVVLKAHEHR
jgi:hypothetical protein